MTGIFAWRYFKAKKSTNAVNIISWVSIVAIAFATAAFLILWSAFNGFESLVKTLYGSFYTDLRVVPNQGKWINLTAEQRQRIAEYPGVKGVTMTLEEKALIQHGDIQVIAQLKGVDDHYTEVTDMKQYVYRGEFYTGDAELPSAVFGGSLESALGLISDRALTGVTVYMPRQGVTDVTDIANAFVESNLAPAGSFGLQQDFDSKYVFTNLAFMQQSMGLDSNHFSAAEIALTNSSETEEVREGLKKILGKDCEVLSRYEQNKSLYAVMQLEKIAIYGIFLLVLVVAAFNMIGALTMLVLEKKKDIQVLQAMGASRSWIRSIFVKEGLLLAGIGFTIGLLLAVGLIYVQINYKLVPLQGTSFVIDYYPVELRGMDIVIVLVTVLAIGIFAAWFPARRAAEQPFELRN